MLESLRGWRGRRASRTFSAVAGPSAQRMSRMACCRLVREGAVSLRLVTLLTVTHNSTGSWNDSHGLRDLVTDGAAPTLGLPSRLPRRSDGRFQGAQDPGVGRWAVLIG